MHRPAKRKCRRPAHTKNRGGLRGADRDLEAGGHRSGGGFEAFFGVGRRALGRFEAAMVDDRAEDFRI